MRMSSLRTCRLSPLRVGDLDLMRKSITDWGEILPHSLSYIESVDFLERRTAFKSLIVDNLLIGVVYTPLSMPIIDPWAYCFGYLSDDDLAEVGVTESLNEDRRDWVGGPDAGSIATYDLDPVIDTAAAAARVNSKRVLILGSIERNKAISEAMHGLGYSVTVSGEHPDLIRRESLANFSRIFSSGYAFKLPRWFIEEANSKIYNLHATYLPFGKGIGTVLFDAFFGHPTGYSIHEINDEIDTGNVLYRRTLVPDLTDTSRTYYQKVIAALNDFTIAKIDFLLTEQLIGTNQSSLYVGNIPYTSRYHFERLIRLLPRGYDTKLTALSLLGKLVTANWRGVSRIRDHIKFE